MFLKELNITNGNIVIRSISFKKGLNLIVDNTPLKEDRKSGNNVGKTTVLRLVDYCLASSGKDIYSDTEFRDKNNSIVKDFLIGNGIKIELVLIEDLDDPLSKSISIIRNFLPRQQKQISINNDTVSLDGLRTSLNIALFDNNDPKPPFRNLIAKFIRDTPQKMSMTLRVLHQTTTLPEYEALHLYLFGIRLPDNILLQKLEIIRRLHAEQRVLDRLSEVQTENGLVQALEIIQREIDSLEKKKMEFNSDSITDQNIEEINRLKSEIASLLEKIGEVELREKLSYESLNELESGRMEYDVDEVRQIYNNAYSLIPNLQVKFEEVVSFHHSMIDNKIKFILNEINSFTSQLPELKSLLSGMLTEERRLLQLINSKLSIDEYNSILRELNQRYELKGSRSERLNQIRELKGSIAESNKRLGDINSIISEAEKVLIENEIVFNKSFSTFSKELYNEEFYLSHTKNESEDVYIFEINSIQSNMGGGKKKGQIAAFDLAYIVFAQEKEIKSPNFVLHDSTEDVHINQLMKIADIADRINGQYVLAILRDKFSAHPEGEKLIDENVILELNQDNKLFGF